MLLVLREEGVGSDLGTSCLLDGYPCFLLIFRSLKNSGIVEEVEGTSPEEKIPRGSSEFLPVEGVQAYSKQIAGVGDAERRKD